MEIRRATEADAETISRLNADIQELHARALPKHFKPSAPDSFPPEKVRTLLGYPQVRMWIAWLEPKPRESPASDAEPAGYAYAEILRYGETPLHHAQEYVYLHHLSVTPAHQRKGYGTALINTVIALAREEKIPELQLDVWAFNSTAQAFFARHGFAPFTVRMARTSS
jgi:diamine N-acetyltransferase